MIKPLQDEEEIMNPKKKPGYDPEKILTELCVVGFGALHAGADPAPDR